MLLHQATYAMALNLGTKDQPIHIDFSSSELKHMHPPEFPVASTSLSLPQRPSATQVPLNSQTKPRNNFREKVQTVLSSLVSPRVCNESLIGEPMTTHSQDAAQPLKRKRVDTKEEPDPELAKRLKKSEKKRRKRERRAARVAQLGNNPSSLQSLSTPFNVDFEPGPSHDSLSRGPALQHVPLTITMPRPRWSTPESHFSLSSCESHSQKDQTGTTPGEDLLELNGQHLLSSSLDSQIPLSTSVPSVPVHDSFPSSMDKNASDHLLNQVANITDTTIPQSAQTGSSLLNRRIKERMALLIEHQRLANSADSLPPAPVHRAIDCAVSEPAIGETISAKQNTLDWAISENKATLAQLGVPLSKEEKLILMKAVTERNKLITRLTTEIKEHLNSSMVVAPTPPLPDSSAMKFKWPETELPLYLVISSDDEDSNGVS